MNIYTNFGNDELYKLIDEAEDKSLTVCEDCGSEENVGLRLTVGTLQYVLIVLKEMLKKEVIHKDGEEIQMINSFWLIQTEH